MNYTFTVYERMANKWFPVASGSCESAEMAQMEMLHYFSQYARDGGSIKATLKHGRKTVGGVATPGAPA